MPNQEHKIYKLVKSLYGLKQNPKQWHKEFDKTVITNVFFFFFFLKIHGSNKCVILSFKEKYKKSPPKLTNIQKVI